MIRTVLVAAAALVTACSSGAVTPEDAPRSQRTIAFLETARGQLDRGRADVDAQSWLGSIPNQAAYDRLSTVERHQADDSLARMAFCDSRWDVSHAAFKRATLSPHNTRENWLHRLSTATLTHDAADGFATFMAIRKTQPDDLSALNDETFSALDEDLGLLPDAGEARFQFESHLNQWSWTPRDVYFSAEVIQLHYAAALIERGQTAKAREVVQLFRDPYVVVAMTADKRFDQVPRAESVNFPTQETAVRELRLREQMVKVHPDASMTHAALASAFLLVDQPARAVASADRAIALSRSGHGSCGEPIDETNLPRIVKAQALFRLARHDEALATAGLLKDSYPDAARGLVTGEFLLALGRNREALVALDEVGAGEGLRPRFRNGLYALRACASHRRGDPQGYKRQMALLAARPAASAHHMLNAYLCAGDLNGAAAYAETVLADPARRHLMLSELQIYLPTANPTPYQSDMDAARAALRRRPEVQRALSAVGRAQATGIVGPSPAIY